MAEPTPSTFLHTQKVLCAAVMASLVVMLAAVIPGMQHGTETPPVWAIGVLVALAAIDVALIPAIGYRYTPIAPGTPEEDARRSSAGQLQSTTVLRFAIAEAVAITSIALAFVVDEGGLFVCVLGVVLAELLMFWHVWPSERLISRAQEALERDGARSYLREALDSPPPPRS